MRFFLELSYNGKLYHGWQIQPNANTVQQTLENGLSMLLGIPTAIVGAGRTDSGVHARQMFAHFDLSSKLDDNEFNHFILTNFITNKGNQVLRIKQLFY